MDLAMRTTDGHFTVEVYRAPRSKTHWYRLLENGQTKAEHLTIAGVGYELEKAGYSVADLEEAV